MSTYNAIRIALGLMDQLLVSLPQGDIHAKWPAPHASPTHHDAELERLGIDVKRALQQRFGGSLAVRQVDASSCNGGAVVNVIPVDLKIPGYPPTRSNFSRGYWRPLKNSA